ncbi:hypothetical protein THAOC_10459, partial [Thalassiosira oceanica]
MTLPPPRPAQLHLDIGPVVVDPEVGPVVETEEEDEREEEQQRVASGGTMTILEARTASGGPMTKIYEARSRSSRSKAGGVVTSKMKNIVDESKVSELGSISKHEPSSTASVRELLTNFFSRHSRPKEDVELNRKKTTDDRLSK